MRTLDTYNATFIADLLEEALSNEGFPPDEVIPGLVVAMQRQAKLMPQPQKALDEAIDLLG